MADSPFEPRLNSNCMHIQTVQGKVGSVASLLVDWGIKKTAPDRGEVLSPWAEQVRFECALVKTRGPPTTERLNIHICSTSFNFAARCYHHILAVPLVVGSCPQIDLRVNAISQVVRRDLSQVGHALGFIASPGGSATC